MDMTLSTSRASLGSSNLAPRASRLAPRAAFTLVELLVVITIISILAALITVAAVGALKTMSRTRIKVEINELASGLDEYKNKFTAYPPNCQSDGSSGPLDDQGTSNTVLLDLRRHIKQMAGRSQESDNLARVLVGQPTGTLATGETYTHLLEGGISAAEAIPFWLGGFSNDPKYPITGDGGPSYSITGITSADRPKADPIEQRKWVYPFDITRLGPRTSDGYFDETKGRYIEYTITINGVPQSRRINFWQYMPAKSQQPFVYFDTSRHPVGKVSSGNLLGTYDPPAATYNVNDAGDLTKVYAFKKKLEAAAPTTAPQIQFINIDKFQVFHCGIDDAWDTASFLRMTPGPATAGKTNTEATYLLFPGGPFIGEISDTEVNFASETTIEDAQK